MLLYCFDIISGTDRGYCKRVAQIVKAGIGSANFCDDLFEFQIDGLMFQVMTQLISKHKTGILPGRTVQKLILQLPAVSSAKSSEHEIGEGNGAALIILGGIQCVLAPAATDLLKLFVDDELALYQINTVFLKTQDLTLTHTGKKGSDEQILVFVPFDCPQKEVDGIVI